MTANKVQKIFFVKTKGGHIAAIVNGQFTVVKNEEKTPIYNVYQNVAGGSHVEPTEDLINEFSTAFIDYQEEKERALEQKRLEAARIERERIQGIEKSVAGMTPNDFCECYSIKATETARHWSDLYEGRSSFAFIIDNDTDLELVEIASEVNKWGGEFGELKRRDGEHHSTFSSVYDLHDYRKNCENYFSEQYFYRDKETEHETFLDRIKEAESMDDIRNIMTEYDNIEDGYYSNGGSLVVGGNFTDFWGYYYDVYSYSFGYKLPSKAVFYDGIEEDEDDIDFIEH